MRLDILPFNRRRDHSMEDERNLDSSGGGVDVDDGDGGVGGKVAA